MFSGIVSNIGVVYFFDLKKKILGIKSNFKNLKIGESISCSGVCLTVFKKENNIFFCNLSNETINKTNFSKIKIGCEINLERSLKVGDEISGHLVFGHVDGKSKVEKILNNKDSWEITFTAPQKITKFLAEKCSICLDGVSLTVNEVYEKKFKVCLVPHTWKNTTFKNLKNGSMFNTEIDMLARYVHGALKK